MGEQPPCEKVEQSQARAVRDGQRDRREDAVPARRDHQVERKVADRVKVALRACREEILLKAPGNQLEGEIIVVVEKIPVDILAGEDRPHRASHRRNAVDHQTHAGSTP
jgi:hypothetical protein